MGRAGTEEAAGGVGPWAMEGWEIRHRGQADRSEPSPETSLPKRASTRVVDAEPPPFCGICGKGGYTEELGSSAGLKATKITTYNREKPFSDTTPL